MDGGKELAVRRGAAGWIGRRLEKRQWAKKGNGRIEERNSIGPSDVGPRVRGSGRGE
jgi:hypothetical protein